MRKKQLKKGIGYFEFDSNKVCKKCWYKFHNAFGYQCDFFAPIRFKVAENGTCSCWREEDESVSNGE
jgi:hypothetical protein